MIFIFDETDYSLIKLKNVKTYSFPEYYSCNKTTLLTSVFTHCKSSGGQSTYIGHAGGGMEINNDDIFIGLGDTNIASSVFNSTYTTRNGSLPWGTILKFKFDYDNLELIGNGNHKDSSLSEVWITGVRNPYRFSINGNSMWIADLGTYIEDEINFVSLNDNNIDLGWPFYEGAFSHQPFPYYSNDKTSFKAPIFSERIGGLIGGQILKVDGKNIYIYGTLDGRLFGLEIQNNGILKVEFNLPEFDFGDGNILLSIEKSRLGILLMSSDGLITEIKNS